MSNSVRGWGEPVDDKGLTWVSKGGNRREGTLPSRGEGKIVKYDKFKIRTKLRDS